MYVIMLRKCYIHFHASMHTYVQMLKYEYMCNTIWVDFKQMKFHQFLINWLNMMILKFPVLLNPLKCQLRFQIMRVLMK